MQPRDRAPRHEEYTVIHSSSCLTGRQRPSTPYITWPSFLGQNITRGQKTQKQHTQTRTYSACGIALISKNWIHGYCQVTESTHLAWLVSKYYTLYWAFCTIICIVRPSEYFLFFVIYFFLLKNTDKQKFYICANWTQNTHLKKHKR